MESTDPVARGRPSADALSLEPVRWEYHAKVLALFGLGLLLAILAEFKFPWPPLKDAQLIIGSLLMGALVLSFDEQYRSRPERLRVREEKENERKQYERERTEDRQQIDTLHSDNQQLLAENKSLEQTIDEMKRMNEGREMREGFLSLRAFLRNLNFAPFPLEWQRVIIGSLVSAHVQHPNARFITSPWYASKDGTGAVALACFIDYIADYPESRLMLRGAGDKYELLGIEEDVPKATHMVRDEAGWHCSEHPEASDCFEIILVRDITNEFDISHNHDKAAKLRATAFMAAEEP